MQLSPGARVGPYEISGILGIGGMGEVYRAKDSRLNRDVALKALPARFRVEPDRVDRFEREAQLLASLNHPHIASIYGLEEAADAQFIVLELVDGGNLGDRLATGPLDGTEALRIARDVADALAAAHDKGIIHRDLKPANIALTARGRPKVLDFGLAKTLAPGTDLTTIAGGTRAGSVLGTTPYMSPEQARGLAIDKRTDIWAFGCVLYEMLTGRQPFTGQSNTDVMVSILEREPDLEALPAATPARVRWLLRRCLEKQPDRRLHDITDARIELDDLLSESGRTRSDPALTATVTRGRTGRGERIMWTAAVLTLLVVSGVLLWSRRSPERGASEIVYRSSIVLPEGLRLTALEPASRFAVSPNGRRIVFVAANTSGVPMLWVRPLDSLAAQPIAGTEGASYPFWSPDSKSLAFVASPTQYTSAPAKLMKVDLEGGAPVALAEVTLGAPGAWSRDNVILFTPTGTSPLFRVSTTGGQPSAVTTLETSSGDTQHSYPHFLPDGRHFVYTVIGSRSGATAARAIYLASLDPAETPRLLVEGRAHAKYANGHLLFIRDATLLAQRFDATTLQLQGEPSPVTERVQSSPSGSGGGAGAFSVSDTGVLVYQTGLLVRSQLTWVDRTGKVRSTLGEIADYADVVLSPDGSRVAVSVLDPLASTRDIWALDVARGTRERLTDNRADDYAPVWSPDGDRLAFSSSRTGGIEIHERSIATGQERMIDPGNSPLGKFAASWSPDGRSLLFIAGGRVLARSDLHVMNMERGGTPTPFLESTFIETQARFSPDGKWVAYAMNDSGRMEVYVVPFDRRSARRPVSVNGGAWPRWRSDGSELFFLAPDGTMMSAAVTGLNGDLQVGTPRTLFRTRLRPAGRLDAYAYDVHPDGQRFLLNTFIEEATSTGLTLVVNWPSAVK